MNKALSHSFSQALNSSLPLNAYVVKARRQLHRIPELGMEETLTYALIHKKLKVIQRHATLPFSITLAKGGLIVDVPGKDPLAPMRLFRADIDGLPIEEISSVPFRSKHKGLMHACGHDGHSAMLLAYLRLAVTDPNLAPEKPVRLVWQRSEERGPQYSGALCLLEEGVLDNVSHVYALHLNSLGPSGQFLSKPGPFLASTGELFIEISAQGGHVMRQDSYPSALYVANNIFLKVNKLRKSLPKVFKDSHIIPTIMQTGRAINIRPSHAKLGLAIRHYMDQHEENQLIKLIQKEVEEEVELAPKAKLSLFDYQPGYRLTYNTPQEFTTISEEINMSGGICKEVPPLYAGEDFGYFLEQRPGCYFQIGAQLGDGVDHHSPYFVIDESALIKGTAFWLFLSQRP